MSTVYIDRKNIQLRIRNKSLEFKCSTTPRGSIPLAQIERLVIRGSAEFSTSLLGSLADSGIGVCVLSGRHNRHLASFVGRPHKDVKRKLGQFHMYSDPDARIQWSRKLLVSKIEAQLRLLNEGLEQRPDKRIFLTKGIRALRNNLNGNLISSELITLPQLMGIEGSAARNYFTAFSCLFTKSLQFKNRNRRPPQDPVNSCLSLGYTLLHQEAIFACYSSGLDPMLGILHEPKYGRESLACDIVEPLRPHVDKWVWNQFRKRTLSAKSFSRDKGAVILNKAGRRHFYAEFNPLKNSLHRLLRIQMLRIVREFEDKYKENSKLANQESNKC